MNLKWRSVIIGLIACLSTSCLAGAQEIPARPEGYVSDFARVLSTGEYQRISDLARSLDEKTGAQLAVVTVKSVQPTTIEDYAVRLFERWGIGQRGKDNGILILVAVADRRVRIETGYGLEGVLTDVMSKTVVERFMVPQFRQELYGQGILAGSAAVVSLVAQSYGVSVTGEEQRVYHELQRGRQGEMSPVAAFFIFIVFLILFILNPRLFLYMMMFSAMGGGRRGYWGGSGSGFGGGYGGGFGGFGGGMSGGGGASGRW